MSDPFAAAVSPTRAGHMPGTEELSALTKMINRLLAVNEEVEKLNEKLNEAQVRQRELGQKCIPEYLTELGMKSLKLEDGTTVSVFNKLKASIKKDCHPQVHQWIREAGYGDLIKNVVSAQFNKEQDNDANSMMSLLEKHGFNCSRKTDIHYQTLNKLVKDLRTSGKDVPEDILNIFEYSETKIGN